MSDSVGSVSVDVVPDARGWAEKLRAQIRDQTVKVQAEADTTEANAKLDEAARTRTAKIKTDTSQLSKGATVLDGFIGKLGLLPSLAVVAGSALVPLAATLGGMAAALAAPLVIAGGGATLFAFMGGLAVKDAQKQLKNIDAMQKHLATLTKGTSAYTAAQKQLKDAQDALPKSVGAFSSALEGLKSTFAHVSMDVLLKPITAGLKLLTDILPLLNPLLTAASGAFTTMIGELDKGAKSQGFAQFIHTVAHQMGPDLLAFAHIAGNIGRGLGGLLTTLGGSHLSGGLLSGLERLSHSFADWGNSKDARHEMRQFFGYVHDVGPQVAHTIGAIARALGKVVEALAPLGPVVLKGIQGAASGLAAIPIPVLTALAAAFAGLVGFQKVGGFKVASFLTKGLGGDRGSSPANPVWVASAGGGGIGGGRSPGGSLARSIPIIGSLITAGAISKQFADNERERNLQQFGTNDIVKVAIVKLDRSLLAHGIDPSGLRTTPVHVGPFTFAVPNSDIPNQTHLTSTTTHLDALRASLGKASRTIDQIGPHASATFAQADKAVDTFSTKLAAIHDKQVRVILQDQAAVRELERIQAMRINDKYFNIYARNQAIERTVGPGGGMGHPALTSSGSGGGGAGVTYTGPITVNAQDHADMQRQMQRRQRQAAISGVQVP